MRGVSGGEGDSCDTGYLTGVTEPHNLTSPPSLYIHTHHTHHTYSVLGNVAGIIDIHTGRMYFSFLC